MMEHDANTKLVTYYNDPAVVGFYKDDDGLNPFEAALLARVNDELQNQPILDIGIGGGRVTPYLRQISKAYTGIDYSEGMIEATRRKFPGVDLLTCDARDLSRFQNGQFAAAVFFGAGIDDVTGAERLQILKEISRVLRNGGIFMFSSHNMEAHFEGGLGRAGGLRLCRNQRVFVADNLIRLQCWISHCKGALRNTIHDRGHAVFVDYDPCFATQPKIGVALRTYYMRRSAQIRQLIDNGFSEAEAVDRNGNTINDDKAAKSIFLHYMARKQK
jgi:ubiquinone/menaquinone biosynthesis C-methylase UbiE